MHNCIQSEEFYDDKLNLNMKIVIIDENRKEYDRFEINKKTCNICKKEQKK
ncbi:hypothetical protein PT447_10915 [Aliarcobacter butzleri]|uniref:hypothetical protein n=1 Tax=Aliarcobacter butzleri TaxID=28197 RepID=UPI0024DE91B0|nr:hypothetical protein [Aliarcobacter butzleri]MDK2065437.1 hypothetical protein [Aliarcobacter butzleri]